MIPVILPRNQKIDKNLKFTDENIESMIEEPQNDPKQEEMMKTSMLMRQSYINLTRESAIRTAEIQLLDGFSEGILHFCLGNKLIKRGNRKDLIFRIKTESEEQEYRYSPKYNTLSRSGMRGTKYINGLEREKEVALICYELKKAFLKQIDLDSNRALAEGRFTKANFYQGNLSILSPQKESLMKEIQNLDELIALLSHYSVSFSGTFGVQVCALLESLRRLCDFEWNETIKELVLKLFQRYTEQIQLAQSATSAHGSTSDYETREKQFTFVLELEADLKQGNTNIDGKYCKLKKEEVGKMSELANSFACEYLADLIRSIDLEAFSRRHDQISRELNQVEVIESKMRDIKIKIKQIEGGFSAKFELTRESEERFKRLLKAQRAKNKQEFQEGMGRAKEKSELIKRKLAIIRCKYDPVYELRDLNEAIKLKEKQYQLLQTKEDQIACNKQLAIRTSEMSIPLLEEERDFLQKKIEQMDRKSNQIAEKIIKVFSDESNIKDLLNKSESEENVRAQKINHKYSELNKVNEDVKALDADIKEKQRLLAGVPEKHKSVFKDRIFEEVRGNRNGNFADNGGNNHRDCYSGCAYRSAVNRCVEESLFQANSNSGIIDAELMFDRVNPWRQNAHQNYGFWHSIGTPRGGKHTSDLKEIPVIVQKRYQQLLADIKNEEDKYKEQISNLTATLNKKLEERAALRNAIVAFENESNEGNLKIKESNMKETNLTLRSNYLTKKEHFFKNCQQKIQDLIASINALRTAKEDEVAEIRQKIQDKKDEIDDILTEIHKEGEYNVALAVSQTRWICSRFERIIANIGNLQKQEEEQGRLDTEREEMLKQQTQIDTQITDAKTRLEEVKKQCKESKVKTNNLLNAHAVQLEKRCVTETEKNFGSSERIRVGYLKEKDLKACHEKEINEFKRARSELVWRYVYETMLPKGTIDNFEDDWQELQAQRQLFKTRKHTNCQNGIHEKKCNYFALIFKIMEILLQDPEMALLEFESKINETNAEDLKHVLNEHEKDFFECTTAIRTKIQESDGRLQLINDKYKKKSEALKSKIELYKKRLLESKRYDDEVIIEHPVDDRERDPNQAEKLLNAGADFIVFSSTDIYTHRNPTASITSAKLVELLASGPKSMNGLKEPELLKEVSELLDKRRVTMEKELMQKESTPKQKFYELLVDYLQKENFTMRFRFKAEANQRAKLGQQKREIRAQISELEREKERLAQNLKQIELFDLVNKKIMAKQKNSPLGAEISDDLIIQEYKECYQELSKVLSERTKEIKNYKESLQQDIGSIKAEIKNMFFVANKNSLLNNYLKVGLGGDGTRHRYCVLSCNYKKQIEFVIKDVFANLSNRLFEIKGPEYRISAGIKDALFRQLGSNKTWQEQDKEHLKTHQEGLVAISNYAAERYGKKRDNIISRRKNEIKIIEGYIAKIEWDREAQNDILIQEINERLALIDEFLDMYKESAYKANGAAALESEQVLSEELSKYQEQYIQESLTKQVGYLIATFQKIGEILASNKTEREQAVAVHFIACVCKVFEDCKIYLNPNETNHKQFIEELTTKLNQELSAEQDSSELRRLVKKKATNNGAVDYILQQILWLFEEDNSKYDERFNPLAAFAQVLADEARLREETEKKSLAGLHKQLEILEAAKKEAFMRDNSSLRKELHNIELCIECINNASNFAALRKRMEDFDAMRKNKDTYYSIEIENHRICIRLMNTDPIEKSAEIKEIDKIQHHLTRHVDFLLEKKALRQSYQVEFEEKLAKESKEQFLEIQRDLFGQGISLIGYSSFENGEKLDATNSLIAAVLGSLLNQDSVYQNASLNSVSELLGLKIRKLRLKYDKAKADQLNQSTKEEDLVRMVINDEFKTDGLQVRDILLLQGMGSSSVDKGGRGLKPVSSSSGHTSVYITVWTDGELYLSLCSSNRLNTKQLTDPSFKIAQIIGHLKADQALWQHFCELRMKKVLDVKLETTTNLGEILIKERKSLAKISTLREFNAEFCSVLDDQHHKSLCLLTYLVYLEQFDKIREDDGQDQELVLRIVKKEYENAFLNILKAEQQRRKMNNQSLLAESKEELYLKELIKDSEPQLHELEKQIQEKEELIANDQELVASLLAEKEGDKEQCMNKISQLANKKNELIQRLNQTQEKLTQLNKQEKHSEEQIADAKAKVDSLQAEIENIEKEITNQENTKRDLEQEMAGLINKKKESEAELERVKQMKQQKENQLAKKKQEIDSAKDVVRLIENLRLVLSEPALQTEKEKENIRNILSRGMSFFQLLEDMKSELEKFKDFTGKKLSGVLTEGIDYPKLANYIISGSRVKIAGETQADFEKRFRAVIRDATKVDTPELCEERSEGRTIKRLKFVVTNVDYVTIHKTVKEFIEKKMKSDGLGMGFTGDLQPLLTCSECGIKGFQELPNKLKELVEKRIELHYPWIEAVANKKATFQRAARVINELRVEYFDVIWCYIDEIQITVSGNFILNKAPTYSGIDLTILGTEMRCADDDLTIDTSGRHGKKFAFKQAANGITKRVNNIPKGDRGEDGFDGDHGCHAGNIVIKIENKITNLEALKLLVVNGGNGGQGQLGGDGDEGAKGADGKSGVAEDTRGFGGPQTKIGFGSPGQPGGYGGSCGKTGREGKGGKPGVIKFIQNTEDLSAKMSCEKKAGRDADNILDYEAPKGGEGGEPGKYGMDEVKDKSSFFSKTVTKSTVIDRKALIEKYPDYKEQIAKGENVSSNRWGISRDMMVLPAVALFIPMAPALILGAFLFTGSQVEYPEIEEAARAGYRDRDKNDKSKRGQTNEEKAQLRDDFRKPQEVKREATNVDSLYNSLNEKKQETLEISGSELHAENINAFEAERDELTADIDKVTHEVNSIESELQQVSMEIEAKLNQLNNIAAIIASLRNNQAHLNTQRKGEINRIIQEIRSVQRVRDSKSSINSEMEQILAQMEQYNSVGEQFEDSKANIIRIIDEYIETVRNRMKRNRYELNQLSRDRANIKTNVAAYQKRILKLQHERLAQVTAEVQIEEEIEQEVEVQMVAEHEFQRIVNFEPMGRSSIIKKPLSKLKESYFKEKDEVKRIKESLRSLNAIQRVLLLKTLQKIASKYCADRPANATLVQKEKDFVLKLIARLDTSSGEQIKQLEELFQDKFLPNIDDLKCYLNTLIEAYHNLRKFQPMECGMVSDKCEEIMLQYNKNSSLENLYEVFRASLNQSLTENYSLTVLENIKYHADALLGDGSEDCLFEKFVKSIVAYKDNIKVISQSAHGSLEQILQIAECLVKQISELKNNKAGRKKTNKLIEMLKRIAQKLIKYADNNNMALSRVQKRYLKLTINEEELEDLLDELEIQEDNVVSLKEAQDESMKVVQEESKMKKKSKITFID